MIKKIWVIFIWLVLIAGVVKAQPQRSVILSAWTDNLTSRGSNFQYTTNLRHNNRTGQQGKVFTRSMQFGCRLGFYHRTANHNGYLGMPFLRWQRQRPKGLIIDWEIGLGYLVRQNLNNTYELVNGKVHKRLSAVLHRFFPALGVGLGWNFGPKYNIPCSFFIRANTGLEIPNNISVLPHLQTEIGVSYHY